jgi:HEAT repeat protein
LPTPRLAPPAAALARRLESDSARTRAKAAFDVGRRRLQALRPHLRRALSDPHPEVRVNAAAALGRFRGEGVCKDLRRAARDADPGVRGAALLGRHQARCAGTRRAALAVLGDPRSGRQPRAAAVLVLGERGGPVAARALVRAIGEDAVLRPGAQRQIARLGEVGIRATVEALRRAPSKHLVKTLEIYGPRAFPTLKAAWPRLERPLYSGMLQAAGRIGKQRAAGLLAAAVKGGSAASRLEALEAIVEILQYSKDRADREGRGFPKASLIPVLARRVDLGTEKEAALACFLASRLGAPTRWFRPWLTHRYHEVRTCARDHVFWHPTPALKAWLRKQLQGPHRKGARFALARLHPRRALPRLLARLRTRRAWKDELGHEVYDHPKNFPSEIGLLVELTRHRVPLLLRLVRGPVRRLRWAAAHALRQLRSPRADRQMLAWLASPRRERRRLAAMVLHERAQAELRLAPVVTLALFGDSSGQVYQDALAYARQEAPTPQLEHAMCVPACLTSYPHTTLAAKWLSHNDVRCAVGAFADLAGRAAWSHHRETALGCIRETAAQAPRAVAAFADALWDPVASVRCTAMDSLSDVEHLPADLVPPLERLVRQGAEQESREALPLLARLARGKHRARILALVRRRLRSSSRWDRHAGVQAVVAAKARELRRPLIRILARDPHLSVAVDAAAALARLGITPGPAAMNRLYQRKGHRVLQARIALARLGHQSSQADLHRQLGSLDKLYDSDKQALFSTLVRLGDPAAPRALDEQPWLLQAEAGTRRHLPTLLVNLYKGVSHGEALIAALGRLRDVRAVPHLARLLRSPRPTMGNDHRPEATQALARIGGPRAREALRAASRSRDRSLRRAAKKALRLLHRTGPDPGQTRRRPAPPRSRSRPRTGAATPASPPRHPSVPRGRPRRKR